MCHKYRKFWKKKYEKLYRCSRNIWKLLSILKEICLVYLKCDEEYMKNILNLKKLFEKDRKFGDLSKKFVHTHE